MKKRDVKFMATARHEIRELFGYISKEDVLAARRIVARIESRAESLRTMPYIGVALDRSEYPLLRYPFRKLSVPPYGLYYVVSDEYVRIVHVIHDTQDVRRIQTGESSVRDDDDE